MLFRSTDTASQFTFPASKWVNGNTYNWSVNTKDALGAAGPFAPDSLVVGSSTPVATVNSPSGLITDTSYPEVSWDFTQDQSQPQTEFEVKIFTDEAYGGGGFDPESSTIVWTSGVITSSAEVITPTLPLPNADTYRAYVRVRAGGVWSVWVYSQFTLSLLIPEAPILTLNPLPGTASIALGVLARLNLLSEVNSNIEASVGDWLDELNSLTPAQFATSPIEGTYSLLSIVAAAYEDIDANFTDYDAVDSSFADYDAMSIYIS